MWALLITLAICATLITIVAMVRHKGVVVHYNVSVEVDK